MTAAPHYCEAGCGREAREGETCVPCFTARRGKEGDGEMGETKVVQMSDVLRALLATLPKCCECERPATRHFMSKHGPIPASYAVQRGKWFQTRPYSGCSAGVVSYVPSDGTWNWDCCDEHAMPDPMGVWDYPIAECVRNAHVVLTPAGDA